MKATLVLCHRPKNLISKGIRYITKSYWNHGAIIYNGNVYEATEGVKCTEVNYWLSLQKKHDVELMFIDVFLVNEPLPLVGLGYDYAKLFNEVMLYYTGLEIFSNRDDSSKWFCFELCAYCMGLPNTWNATGLTFDKRPN